MSPTTNPTTKREIHPISQQELADVFRVLRREKDHRFCFLIGSGASVSSDIRAGGPLARIWIEELKARLKGDFEKWKAEKGIDENRVDEHYTEIYRRRFLAYPHEGHLFLEEEMNGKKPFIGYAILALFLEQTDHNFVITTNFDSLLEDALHSLTTIRPLVCGHENLASYIRSHSTRPTLIKVHRDLLLDPFNTPEETAKLKEQWVDALSSLLSNFPLVVVGYGGNDGSLMDWLGSVKNRRAIYWCTRGGKPPGERIMKLLSRPEDRIVSIEGFDDLMFSLARAVEIDIAGKLLGADGNDGPMVARAREMEKSYRNAWAKFVDTSTKPDDALKLVGGSGGEKTNERKTWFEIYLMATAEKDLAKRDVIYRQGVIDFPNSFELLSNYANFLTDVRKDHDRAESLYKKALELDPNFAEHISNYANFLKSIRKDYDRAEKLYKKALELDPNNADITGNYAFFLNDIRKDHDRAETLYNKALELDPCNAFVTGNYAVFLKSIRKDYNRAETLYIKALELDPNNANITGNYAIFLNDVRKDHDRAEFLFKKALELDANNASQIGNYANFLKSIRKDYDRAEKLYKKALELDPNNAYITGNYASLLFSVGKTVRAKEYLLMALNGADEISDLRAELQFYRLAHCPELRDDARIKLLEMIKRGDRSPNWSFAPNIERAAMDGYPDLSELCDLAEQISGVKHAIPNVPAKQHKVPTKRRKARKNAK